MWWISKLFKAHFILADMLGERTAKQLHREAVQLLGKRTFSSQLDIACGTGALLRRLSKRVEKQYGTDMDVAHFAFPDATFVESDLNAAFPYPDKKFQLITAVEIIEHIENTAFFMREISKRLEKGGWLLLTSPNIYNVWSKLLFLFKHRFLQFLDGDLDQHVNPLIEHIFLHYAKQYGLKLIRKKYSSGYIPLLSMYVPFHSRFWGNVGMYVFVKE